jgi:uncharacterized protein
MLCGVAVGYVMLGRMDGDQVRVLIGVTVLGMTLLQMFRSWQGRRRPEGEEDRVPHSLWFRAPMGMIGGIATTTANAAGPVAQLYFLSLGLAKMAFIGTGAWCFFMLNLIKVPLLMDLDIIHGQSLKISGSVVLVAMFGALVAPMVVRHIRQELFTRLVWIFIIVAGLKLLW